MSECNLLDVLHYVVYFLDGEDEQSASCSVTVST
jgi:hypothetical protein